MKKSMLILAALMISLLVLSLNRQVSTSATEEVDITELIKTAKTPEDHIKIAEYYEEQRAIMEKQASLHESMAEAYEGTKMTGMTNHCENLSKEFKQSAEQYKAMAEEHEKMAQEMQSQQPQ
ncbi:MAG: hypothetical protein AB1598_03730 [Thermodesulfobacteriota bacterium]